MPTNVASKVQAISAIENSGVCADGIVETAHHLSRKLAERAAEVDQNDSFVGENYTLLKEAGLVEAGVPRELGGRGAEISELAEMLRVLARACGFHRTRLFHEHASGRHTCLALASLEGGRRRASLEEGRE